MTHNWFSNFVPYNKPLVLGGVSYPTPEHWYQAAKVVHNIIRPEGDWRTWREWVADAPTPGHAKRRGRQVPLRSDWDDVKEKAMEIGLRHRLEDPEWVRKLIAHEGEIIEWNYWHDNIWGVCTCIKRCRGGAFGRNLLGKLLMKLREEILDA